MTRYRYATIVLDFDGVIAESVDVKTAAFARIYAPYGPEVVAKVTEHHQLHGGVSRQRKFEIYHRDFLGKSISPTEIEHLSAEFSRLVEDEVVRSEYVIGAREFLDRHWQDIPLFVASGTPGEELVRIVRRRGIESRFRGVFGSPATKSEILRRIASSLGLAPSQLLMVGDSMTDFDGARQAGTAFVGRGTPQAHPFPPGTRVIPDLSELEKEILS